MKRLTLKRINAELASRGYNFKLFKGKDYFYFAGGSAGYFEDSMVCVPTLNSMTLEDWMDESISKTEKLTWYGK